MQANVGFGGGCHWCTEAVFLSIKGVVKVAQGWIASQPPYNAFSEAVTVSYDPQLVKLHDLIAIHLHTHAATANHSMRTKYRSAVYWFDAADEPIMVGILQELQAQFLQPIITQVLPFALFKPSLPRHQNYYYNNPEKPFCKVYIQPKIQLIHTRFKVLAAKK